VIDLHTHTNESDGTYSPQQLIELAVRAGLEALAITDHDTFSGYEQARPFAEAAGLPVYCGIELSTALGRPKERTAHLLGYFANGGASESFRNWLGAMQQSRRDRNQRMARRLQSLGVNVTIEEVNAIGRNMAGRPHFAKLLLQKGYVQSHQEAFDRYLDEAAPGYVEREEPTLEEAIRLVSDGGGISSLAHPVRLGKGTGQEEEKAIAKMVDDGLTAIEAFHSDHTERDTERYLGYARKYGLKVTGGSDFHGDNKPSIRLGTGANANLNISKRLLEELWS
jgi:predicted metal-dependent phosphoesterase TrpH